MFSLTLTLAADDPTCGTDNDNPGCILSRALPQDLLFYSQSEQVDSENRNWNESLEYYKEYDYSQTIESEAESQTSAWGDVLRGLAIVVGVIKFGIAGVFIVINAILREAGVAVGTRYLIAGMFQTGVYFVYLIGLMQYIRGSGTRGYD
jgi:hypothetical protein